MTAVQQFKMDLNESVITSLKKTKAIETSNKTNSVLVCLDYQLPTKNQAGLTNFPLVIYGNILLGIELLCIICMIVY